MFLSLQLPPLASNIFFPIFNHEGAVFFFFLLLSLQPSVRQMHHEEDNFFLKYLQSIWFSYARSCLEAFSSLVYVQEHIHTRTRTHTHPG